MDGEKLIQVSFQLPPSALESLARLAEQLRLLTETAQPRSGAAASEGGVSDSFDPRRFQALRQGGDALTGTSGEIGETAVVSAAASPAENPLESPAAADAGVREEPRDARGTGDALPQFPESRAEADDGARFALSEEETPPPPAEAGSAVPDAAEASAGVEQTVPAPESAHAPETQEVTPAALREAVSGRMDLPQTAGFTAREAPETPGNRWRGAAEELSVPSPAPLTAEDLSLAFERDGRRYDGGFPLY